MSSWIYLHEQILYLEIFIKNNHIFTALCSSFFITTNCSKRKEKKTFFECR